MVLLSSSPVYFQLTSRNLPSSIASSATWPLALHLRIHLFTFPYLSRFIPQPTSQFQNHYLPQPAASLTFPNVSLFTSHRASTPVHLLPHPTLIMPWGVPYLGPIITSLPLRPPHPGPITRRHTHRHALDHTQQGHPN